VLVEHRRARVDLDVIDGAQASRSPRDLVQGVTRGAARVDDDGDDLRAVGFSQERHAEGGVQPAGKSENDLQSSPPEGPVRPPE
jgi:hypothetical protein